MDFKRQQKESDLKKAALRWRSLKNHHFLDLKVHYLSKKQSKTYFLSNLCKIPDIFANDFHISNMKIF